MNPSLAKREAVCVEPARWCAVLEALPENVFADILQLAVQISDTRLALVHFFDRHGNWICRPINVQSCGLEEKKGLFQRVLAQPGWVVIRDVLAEAGFAEPLPVVDGAKVRFYAGLALRTADKRVAGILSVVDFQPRDLSSRQVEALETLGRLVLTQWETVRTRAKAEKFERRRAEEALRQSEPYAQCLIRSSMDMIIAVDRDRRIIEFNPAAEKAFGYRRDEILGQSIDLVYANPGQGCGVNKKILDEDHFIVEVQNRRRNGELFSSCLSASVIRNAAGEVLGVMGISRDITERKHVEETLRRMEMLYRRAIAAANGVPYLRDYRTETFMYMGEGIQALTGYSPSELTMEIWDAVVQEYQLRGELTGLSVEEAIRRVRASEVHQWQADVRIRRRDGQTRWLADASVEILENGESIGSIGTLQDITDRKLAEAQIEKLAAFPRFNPNAVLEFSPDGTLTYFNEAAQAMAASFGRKHPLEILPPQLQGVLNECLSTGKTKLQEKTVLDTRTISWSFFPVLSIPAVHCYASDITERLNLEEQLRQLQKMESVGQLAGGVAHDFNNILTIIQGYCNLLQLEDQLPPRDAESLRQIATAAERAAGLTKQLLAFSRKQVMRPQRLNLNEVVGNLTKMLQRILGEDIVLQFSWEGDVPTVHADTGMIEQVLMNLAVNARDAMPQGGRLMISTTALKVGAEYIRRHPEARPGEFVCLSVRDSGCGIPPEVLPHIFEPFFTTKDVGKGTGLGLATVYGIVAQHQGWIEVNSHLGEGTTLRVCLPAAGEPEDTADDVEAAAPVRGGCETILVVEDEAGVRSLLRDVLRRYGYRVLEAVSGAAALEVWRQHGAEVDLLLTDMVMPDGLTGGELARRLTAERPDLKVIYSTGYSEELLGRNLSVEEGVNFLQKPYNPTKLAQTIRDCLDRKTASLA